MGVGPFPNVDGRLSHCLGQIQIDRGRVPHLSRLYSDEWGTHPIRGFIQIGTASALLLDAGDVADGAAGGAGSHCGVGLERLRDLAGAGGGLPCGCAFVLHRRASFGEFRVGDVDAHQAFGNVDLDGVALFDQGDGAGLGRLGRDVADAEARAAVGEATVGDEGAGFAEALGLEIAGGVEHLLYAGAAARVFLADEDDIATQALSYNFASILSWFKRTKESSMSFCEVISLFENFLSSSVVR